MGLVLVLGYRLSFLPILEGPGLLLLPKSSYLAHALTSPGKAGHVPHPLGQMEMGHHVAVSSEGPLALRSSRRVLKMLQGLGPAPVEEPPGLGSSKH